MGIGIIESILFSIELGPTILHYIFLIESSIPKEVFHGILAFVFAQIPYEISKYCGKEKAKDLNYNLKNFEKYTRTQLKKARKESKKKNFNDYYWYYQEGI